MKNTLLITGHLGLGDHIICNAIYRKFAAEHELICIPVKYHNVPSVAFMLRDVENIVLRPVEDDEEMLMFRDRVWKGQKLNLGCFADDTFNGQIWDQEMFRQAGMSMQLRWDGWKCERDMMKEKDPGSFGPFKLDRFSFVHEDRKRGLRIIQEPICATISAYKSDTIFDWWSVIEVAPIIHCICSSFALFIDSIPLPRNPKLFLHAYARPGEPLPLFQKDWTILK